MKVILLEDVKKVGKKDQVVDVSVGYANNFLFAKNLAVAYTPKSQEILAKQQEDARLLEEKKKADAIELKEKLKSITLEFTAKVGKDGKMFGSISTKQIAEELKRVHGIEIDKRKFVGNMNADMIGYARLEIELYKGVVGTVNVHISEEK